MFMLSVIRRKKVSVSSSISISQTKLTRPLLELFCKNYLKQKLIMLLQLPNQRMMKSLILLMKNSRTQMDLVKKPPMDLLLSPCLKVTLKTQKHVLLYFQDLDSIFITTSTLQNHIFMVESVKRFLNSINSLKKVLMLKKDRSCTGHRKVDQKRKNKIRRKT